MNIFLKHLLRMLGAAACISMLEGCETDADESTGSAIQHVAAAQIVPPPGGTPVVTNIAPQAALSADSSAGLATNSERIAEVTVSTNAVGTNGVSGPPTVIQEIPPAPPAELQLSKAAQEVVKLAQSGVGDTVISLFIDRTDEPFNLDAADIVYLNDIGISNTIIASMLNHDGASPETQKGLTNEVAVAAAPPVEAVQTNVVPPGVQVTSNYVATAPPVLAPGQTVPQYVQEQPQVVVQQPVIVTEPVVTDSYFYSSLSPYGSWVDLPDYGWCWRPTISVVHSGWRPYCHGGRWLYSDAGWYWHSDYSWGWAPFHYGRWYCSPRLGWVWTPGYTWAPSWVTWRRGGDYCGWAPLPPHTHVRSGVGFTYWDHNVGFNFSFGLGREHYTFVSARNFYNHRVIDHVVPGDRTGNIYNNSTVVNNYIVGNNNTVINNGISRDFVASRSATEIRKVSIRDEPRDAGRRIAPDRVTRQNGNMVVYRPTPPAPTVAASRQLEARRLEQTRAPLSQPGAGVAPGNRQAEARQSSRVSPRGEANRITPATPSSLASRGEIPRVVYGTPPPVRPEPQPPISTRPAARTSIESRGTVMGTRPAVPNSGLITTRPSTPGGNSGRPAEALGRIPSINRPGAVPPQSISSSPGVGVASRPGSSGTITSSGAGAAGGAGAIGSRSEVSSGRFGGARPVVPSTAPVSPSPSVNRPIPGPASPAPSTTSPGAGRPAPAVNPGAAPRREQPSSAPQRFPSAPATPPGNRGASLPGGRRFEAARSPDLANPPATISGGPSAFRPQTPPRSGYIVTSQQTGGANSSSFRSAPVPSSAPVTISRSESYSGGRGINSQAFPQHSAPATVLQPREMTPVAPRGTPSAVPSYSVPGRGSVQQSAPAPYRAPVMPSQSAPVSVSPAPTGGGRFNSAPPVSAGRPTVIQSAPQGSSSRGEGRGRVEIGR